jgi:hypothetical protein
VPWHHFLAVDLVPGRCEESQAAQGPPVLGAVGRGLPPLAGQAKCGEHGTMVGGARVVGQRINIVGHTTRQHCDFW